MSEEAITLALKKQRLQMQSALQRQQWQAYAQALAPALGHVDKLHAGFRWLKAHPPALLGTGVATGLVAWFAFKTKRRVRSVPHSNPEQTASTLAKWAGRGLVAWRVWQTGKEYQQLWQRARRVSPGKLIPSRQRPTSP